MPWQGPLTERATAFRQRQLYRPLSTYSLTPRNIIMWSRKLIFYKRKFNQVHKLMRELIANKRFAMEHKRRQILTYHSEVKYFARIMSHYVRLLKGVPSDFRSQIARQAADLGQLNQDIGRYNRSDHRIFNMLRTGNFTEDLDQVPWDILEEYRRRTRNEYFYGRPWRPPVAGRA